MPPTWTESQRMESCSAQRAFIKEYTSNCAGIPTVIQGTFPLRSLGVHYRSREPSLVWIWDSGFALEEVQAMPRVARVSEDDPFAGYILLRDVGATWLKDPKNKELRLRVFLFPGPQNYEKQWPNAIENSPKGQYTVGVQAQSTSVLWAFLSRSFQDWLLGCYSSSGGCIQVPAGHRVFGSSEASTECALLVTVD